MQKLQASGLDADAAKAQAIRNIAGQKIGEMRASLRLYGEVNRDAALSLLDTDIGQKAMTDLRHELRDAVGRGDRAPGRSA